MNFHFKKTNDSKKDNAGEMKEGGDVHQCNTLIFAKIDKIFELNFETMSITTVYLFQYQLSR